MITHEQFEKARQYAYNLVSEGPGTYQFDKLREEVRKYMEREGDNFGIMASVAVIHRLTHPKEREAGIEARRMYYYPKHSK